MKKRVLILTFLLVMVSMIGVCSASSFNPKVQNISTYSKTDNFVKFKCDSNVYGKIKIFYDTDKRRLLRSPKNQSIVVSEIGLNHLAYADKLTSETKYYYFVEFYFNQTDKIISEIQTFTTKTTQKEDLQIKNVSAYSNNSGTEAKVVVETNIPVKVSVFYNDKENLDFSAQCISPQGNVNTAILTNLIPGKMYFYQVIAEDKNGNVVKNSIQTFKTNNVTKFEDIATHRISDTKVIVRATSSLNVSAQIFYGSNQFDLTNALNMDANGTSYGVLIENLKPASTYYYKLSGVSEDGNIFESSIISFTTPMTLEMEKMGVDLVDSTVAKFYLKTNINSHVTLYVRDAFNINMVTDDGLNHQALLENLKPGQTYSYHFVADSLETSDYYIKSSINTFSTPK